MYSHFVRKMSSKRVTVGLIIIGEEILNGRVVDTNSQFALKRFSQLGTSVKKMSILPDDVEIISEEVSKFSMIFDYVVTSGGIGPTEDDVTYEGVAKVRLLFQILIKR